MVRMSRHIRMNETLNEEHISTGQQKNRNTAANQTASPGFPFVSLCQLIDGIFFKKPPQLKTVDLQTLP